MNRLEPSTLASCPADSLNHITRPLGIPSDSVSTGKTLARPALEGLHAFGDLVERLLVDGEDRHLRRVLPGIVERADLDHHDRPARRLGREMGAAVGAELAR